MKKPIVLISTGEENTESENQYIKEAFGQYFKIDDFRNNNRRFSGDILHLIIDLSFSFMASGIYDVLKFSVKNFFNTKQKRQASIRFTVNNSEVIITDKKILKQNSSKTLELDYTNENLDKFFELLKNNL